MPNQRHGKRIVVPTRSIQGGLDFKYETDPYDIELHGLMTPEQYTEAIENLNQKLRRSRAGTVDGALLATGPLLVPLALWGVRHRNQTKRRKRLLKEAIYEFNMQHQELLMRYNRKPQSVLTIERRHDRNPQAGRDESAVAQATLVSDVFAPAAPLPPVESTRQHPQQQQQQQRQPSDRSQLPSSSMVQSSNAIETAHAELL
mmetsp:Transcript_31891/g.53311  ORF Transcript_31891/g.53311 Transcript_31891/m.53311 type:complete len:202 (+) Transcript_31891:303-908(+)